MKKINAIIFSALALIAAASCNKEVDVQNNPTKGKAVVLTAKLEGTKTSLDGVNIVWSRNDYITAFNINGENILSTQTEVNEDGSEAQFTVEPGADLMYAICPANTFATMDGNGTITTEIPTTQTAVAGSFADGANLAIANINDVNNLRFKNVGGLLAFKVKASTHNIVSATISGNVAGEVGGMTGAINVSIDSQDNVSSICSGPCSVTVDGAIEVGQTYYAVVAPGTYSNVTIVFTDDQGNTATYTKTDDLVVERNSNQLIGGFSPDSRWREKYYVKVTSDDDIVAGSYLIVYETLDNDANDVAEVFAGVDLDTNLGTVASDIPVITENGVKKIALSEGGRYNVVVEELNGGYSIGWNVGYLAYNRPAGTEKYNNLYLVASPGVESQWILSVVDGIQNAYNTERYLQYNTGSPRFACYTGSQQDVSLYLLEGTGHSSGKQNVSLSFNPTTVELTLGDTFTAPVLTTNPSGLSVTYASNNEEVATVGETSGEVTIHAAGTASITASFAGDDNYKSGSASYTITVNPVKDYIFYESFDLCTGVGGGTGEDLNGTSNTNIIPDNDNWVFEKGNGANKCAKFGTSSSAGSATTPALGIPEDTPTATLTFKAGAWKGDTGLTLNISIVGNGQASVKSITLLNNQFSDYTVILGNGIDANTQVLFSAAEANKNRFFLDEVKVVAGGTMPVVKTDPVLSFSPATIEVTLGDTFTAPVLTTDPEGLEVTYSSSNTNVATVDASTGAVTLVAAGTTTITATFEENESYYGGLASYSLKVNSNVDNGNGTLEKPFNIAGVYEYINNNGTGDVYISGIISSINDPYGATYGNATFFISDDGTTTAPQFEAYRVLFIGNTKWKTEYTQIKVGDVVIIHGKVTKFHDIYETSQNNAYLYSLNGVSTILESPVFSTETDDLDIIVSWNTVAGASSYEITCGDLSYTVGASETSFTLSMDDYGTYVVRVIAKGTNVEPGVSEPKEVTLVYIDPSLNFIDVPAQSYTFYNMGYENGDEISTIANTQKCSIVFDKGSGSTTPKYFTSGTTVRAYGGNTITVTPIEGYKVTRIIISFGSGDGSNAISVNTGSYDNGTWTGEAKATPIVFTIGGTSGHRRISAIAINPAN